VFEASSSLFELDRGRSSLFELVRGLFELVRTYFETDIMLLKTWITCEGLFGSSRSRSGRGRDRDRDRDRDIVRMINAKMIDYEYDMQSGRISGLHLVTPDICQALPNACSYHGVPR
jgi:hypothetical protein